MRKLILVALSFVFIIIPPVLALQYRNICLDNQTLNKFMNFTSCENVTCIDYNFTQNVDCEFGCDTSSNVCRQSPINEYLLLGVILLIIVIIILILIKVSRR
jgi:hypothetical protein